MKNQDSAIKRTELESQLSTYCQCDREQWLSFSVPWFPPLWNAQYLTQLAADHTHAQRRDCACSVVISSSHLQI